MSDAYLRAILTRIRLNTGPSSPARSVQTTLRPTLLRWAGQYLVSMEPSGSFAKGTAIRGGTDIDIFASVSSAVTDSLATIYGSLFNRLSEEGYAPRQQNVSIGIKIGNYSVDVVPARRQAPSGQFHSLYMRRAQSWTQTNVITHINAVQNSGRAEEIMIVKAWRQQKGLRFPSFYLELATIEACRGRKLGDLSANVWATFAYLRDNIIRVVFIDPANTNNRISDELSDAEKQTIASAAGDARQASHWNQIVQ